MRNLKKDLVTIHYSLYGNGDENDEWGNKVKGYGEIKTIEMNLSANNGDTTSQVFGNDVKYDREMTTHNTTCLIDEQTRLWIKNDISQPHDYIVKKVADTKNIIRYAIQKVNVTNEN